MTDIKVYFPIWHVFKTDARHSFEIKANFETFRISQASRYVKTRGNLDIVACFKFVILNTRLTTSICNFTNYLDKV